MALPWEKIRKEYIETSIGMRPLAQKHGVSFDTLKWRAKHEEWSRLRDEYRIETGVQAVSKPRATTKITTVTTITTPKGKDVDDAAAIFRIADKALEKAEAYLDAVEMLGPQDLSHVIGALAKAKDIRAIKVALDREEQRARIANLEQQTRTAEREPITITFEGTEEAAR